MKISLNWLKEWVDIPWNNDELCEKLADLGFPVDKVSSIGVKHEKIIVAKIISIEKHPNADRLQIAQVFDGKKILQIVCGANNIAPDQIVPLALPGTDFGGGFKIEVFKIRGVESNGMLCSSKELGLSDDHSGIYQLPGKSPIGEPVKKALGEDTILEVDVTPNRPDVLNHYGLAREIAALTGKKLKPFNFKQLKSTKGPACPIQITDTSSCSRYIGRVITNVTVGPSPDWLSQRLINCGIRSINNVVDVTNYVLLEFGHPLHAFDLDKLSGPRLVVRKAKAGESLKALDEISYKLNSQDLVIADETGPLAIAGIMGGQASGVSSDTKSLLLESAVFERGGIRRTSKRLNLKSESSFRFEKGTDTSTAELASIRAGQLIIELAGGVLGKMEDCYPVKPKKLTISFTTNELNKIIGSPIKEADIKKVLSGLELSPVKTGLKWTCAIPNHRKDLLEPIDLIEEVIRVVGYNSVPANLPDTPAHRIPAHLLAKNHDQLRSLLKGFGFNETITNSFCAEVFLKHCFIFGDQLVTVENPISAEEGVLRPSLVPNLLKSVLKNANYQIENVRLFEIGNTFNYPGTNGWPKEDSFVAMVHAGQSEDPHWSQKAKPVSIFDLKGCLEGISRYFSAGFKYSTADIPAYLNPKQSLSIIYRGKRIGYAGMIHPATANALGVTESLGVAEFAISDFPNKLNVFKSYSDIPFVERDIALLVDKSTSWNDIASIAVKSGGALLKDIQVFDLYQGDNLGEGKKSIAFRVRLQDPEKTLSDKEITTVMNLIKSSLVEKTGAQPR